MEDDKYSGDTGKSDEYSVVFELKYPSESPLRRQYNRRLSINIDQ